MSGRKPVSIERSVFVRARPRHVLAAFFDAEALFTWWQVVRSVTSARPLGVFAIEWAPTPERDRLLGRLGGVFYGTVMEFKPAREFFVGGAYWLPPDGEPLGPMALEVSCIEQPESVAPALEAGTIVHVHQSGVAESERWIRYFEVTAAAWTRTLESLKEYIESRP